MTIDNNDTIGFLVLDKKVFPQYFLSYIEIAHNSAKIAITVQVKEIKFGRIHVFLSDFLEKF